MELIFLTHLICTFFMTGLCWFVQVVHYPLFRHIKLEDFPAYEKKNFVTGYLAIPIMVIELATALALLYVNYDILLLINLILIGCTGLSTMLFQVPIHWDLSKNATDALINKIIKTNWIRTISWTIRSTIIGYLILEKL